MKPDSIDRSDWPLAVLSGIALAVFGVAILVMWFEPRDDVPLHYILPFTVAFALVAPKMVRNVINARTRQFRFNATSGTISVSESGLLRKAQTDYLAQSIAALRIEVSSSRGMAWFTAMFETKEGARVIFRQSGEAREAREAAEAVQAFLAERGRQVEITDLDAKG
jgi:hypothetical protein